MDFEVWFREIAAGDEAAYEFCRACHEFFHMFDDLIDRDKPADTDVAILALLKFISVLSKNEFYARHKVDLLQALHTGASAFAASERLKAKPELQDRLAAEVLKSQYMDVFFRVAFLTGGTTHQFECDKKFRGYCFG